MKTLRQLFVGLLSAIGTSLLVIAAGSLALAEGGIAPALPLNPSPLAPMVTASPTQAVTSLPSATPAPGQTFSPTLAPTLTATPTEAFTCQKTPKDWTPYLVQAGDTLDSLAAQTGQTADAIQAANCLLSPTLLGGTILYLPITSPTATAPIELPTALPTVIPTAIPYTCGRPYGWVTYTVRPGDNLYRLSLAFGITQYQLQAANCLVSTYIYAGQQLYVPNVATRTPEVPPTSPPPAPSATRSPSSTTAPSATTAPLPTSTTAPTAIATATATPTATPSNTATATPSATPTPTFTPTPTP